MHSYQELFSESFARTMLDEVRAQALIEAFVERFFHHNQRIERLFDGVDVAVHRKMLQVSILQFASFANTGYRAHKSLQDLAEQHRIMGIERRDYDHWLECLVGSVAEIDPHYRPEFGDAWRIAMAPGIAFMLLYAKVAA